ncbi:MAG: hypothetical protein FGM49_06450 [Candidatus Nanopelagicaceae bacterium]|nr:hypothetical protein [Candidatus Nanopelagicaceae bacterium]
MKKKLIFIVPILALIGFLAIKPPAIGSETGKVVVTPEATITPGVQPHIRDFDDDGNGPRHEDYDDDGDEGDNHHERHHDEDESDEDDYDQED